MLHRGEASKAVSKMISGAPLLNFHHDPFVLLLLSNVSQSHFCSRPEAQDKHLSGMPTADYARWRLEGRALEHGFARAPGSAIRMVSDAGRWEVVHDQGIRTRMNAVARQVRAGMEAAGVRILGADCPCVVSATGEKPTRSVDLRVKVGDLYGVVEVKWSRSDLDAACRSAGKSVSWMKKAVAAPGHFLMGGRKYPIQGQLVGTLGVATFGWRLELQSAKTGAIAKRAKGEVTILFFGATKRKRRYPSGASKRKKSGAKAKQKEKQWRKSGKGKALKLKVMAAYWASAKGKAARKRAALKR